MDVPRHRGQPPVRGPRRARPRRLERDEPDRRGSFDAGTTDDLLAVDGAGVLWRYPGQADGTLGPRAEYGRSGRSVMTELTVGDLNRDGRDDLVALGRRHRQAVALPGRG
jgi:VCBS repeat protein